MREPKWADEIREAILELGGVASLEDIYTKLVERNVRSRTANWKDTVRDAIQQHSSDSKSYRGINNYFYSVYGKGKGIWGVRDVVTPEVKKNLNSLFEETREFELEELIQQGTDEEIEQLINNYSGLGSQAKIEVKEGLQKIRKASKVIIDKLKELYDYSCQICGINPSSIYGVNIVEAHHIEYFSVSQNHNPNNIMILCPNHHRLVHSAKAKYCREKNKVVYENGYEEVLKLEKHLLVRKDN
ncbi:HNH endonuclease [Paenibacillus sp. J22TS3]|uniref:HNH endonuclease n=1 Tax=Paenibacillus sp. J22TS3 TaxID=2807192 RepID=UPI001B135842|nr:HNH endonuclease [Paenibacillus sp. J22TS3]GIP22937.1 hypothetical protein J22TS3_32120 [Paenibacillus sp. J22TS3]